MSREMAIFMIAGPVTCTASMLHLLRNFTRHLTRRELLDMPLSERVETFSLLAIGGVVTATSAYIAACELIHAVQS